jgi:hypothetical protein
MARSRGKTLVMIAALTGALGYALVHRVLSFREGAGLLSDGSALRLPLDGPGLRHVVWDAPRPLGGALEGSSGEERPALSLDGRFLVFASGQRGLNCELYLCELSGGVPGEPRRIAELDGPQDEVAPSFSADYLYFASDRAGGAGGLDLYRARFHDGQFEPPERLADALQSAADETDPAPSADDAQLVFASERGGDFDLWQAGSGAPQRIESLATRGAEREPALSRDGRVLYFASEREGRFELCRSLFEHGRWQPACALELPAGPGERRGPCLSADGFELYFSQAADGEAPHLAHAESREVYVLPGLEWTAQDSAVVASLLVLALSAWLAQRWVGLSLAYKCVLASVLAHLVLLFLLRYVIVGGGAAPSGSDAGPPPSSQPDFSIQPSVRAAPSPGRERAGSLENGDGSEELAAAQPTTLPASEAPASPGEAAGLAQGPVESQPSAPERGSFAPEPLPSADPAQVALATPAETVERRASPAPELALAADSRSSAGASESSLRARPAQFSAGRSSEQAPAGVALARAPAETPSAPERASGAAAISPRQMSADVAVAAPRGETAKVHGSAAPGLALPSAELAEAEPAGLRGPGYLARSAERGEGGAPAAPAPLAPLVQGPAAGEAAPPRRAEGAAPQAGAQAALPGVALASPKDAPTRQGGGSSAAPGLDLGSGAVSSPGGAGASAERASIAASGGAASAPGPLKLGVPAGGTPAGPARSAGAAAPAAASAAVGVELADKGAPEARRGTGGSPSPDLIADLGKSGSGGGASAEASAPRAAAFRAPLESARPSGTGTDSLVRAPESPREVPQVERKSWDNTPYENRAPEPKARALQLHGGDARTEEAVARGLGYLARIQQRGGNWGRLEAFDEKYGQVAVGKTGLCLLAFLGAGHTQSSNSEHSAVVARAIDALLALQDPETGHFGRSDAYSHGIATYALAEDLAMTGDARVRAALEPALAHILGEQNTESDPRLSGGWSYYFPDGHVFDRWPRTAITAWQVMALESARLSGLTVPDATFEAARRFLENAHDEEHGNWRYNHDPQRLRSEYSTLPASTPAAMFALALLGDDLAGAEYAPARAYVLARAPDGYRYSGDDDFVARGAGNLYFWYYGTLAMFRAGGEDWKRWNEAMKRTLLPAQARDGSWEPIEPYARYAKDSAGDKSYSSALCVLSLEVYYRYYLPLLKVR